MNGTNGTEPPKRPSQGVPAGLVRVLLFRYHDRKVLIARNSVASIVQAVHLCADHKLSGVKAQWS